jgi:hypothetical protein
MKMEARDVLFVEMELSSQVKVDSETRSNNCRENGERKESYLDIFLHVLDDDFSIFGNRP